MDPFTVSETSQNLNVFWIGFTVLFRCIGRYEPTRHWAPKPLFPRNLDLLVAASSAD
jgi:hypothetical protein